MTTSKPPKKARKDTSATPDASASTAGQGGRGDDRPPPPLVGEFIGKEEILDEQTAFSKEELSDEEIVKRVEHLNRRAGWVLITAGIIGVVVPGMLGTPFLLMGALALWPSSRKIFERWRKGHSPRLFHGSMKQIERFLNDLDKRYPRTNKR